jgi:hypothetical protein
MIISDVIHRNGDSGMSWFSKTLSKLSGNKVPEIDFSKTFIAKNVTVVAVQRLLIQLDDDDLRRIWRMIGNELAKRKSNG